MFSRVIFALAVAGALLYLVSLRRHIRRGGIVSLPFAAGMFIFTLGIIVVMITGVSSLHLLWWLPCSLIIGLVNLLSFWGQKLVITCMLLLAMPLEQDAIEHLYRARNTRARRKKREMRRRKRHR
jgi:hypothetical protein